MKTWQDFQSLVSPDTQEKLSGKGPPPHTTHTHETGLFYVMSVRKTRTHFPAELKAGLLVVVLEKSTFPRAEEQIRV